MDGRELYRALRRAWILILAVALIGGGAALAASLAGTPVYAAETRVFVSVQQTSTVQDLSQGSTFTQQVVKSYADVATTPIVLDPVIQSLGLHTTPQALAAQVAADAASDTVVISITASDTSPRQAADIANGVARSLGNVVTTLTGGSTADSVPVRITRIQPAVVPSKPSGLPVWAKTVLAAIAGALLGAAFALGRARVDTRIHSEKDIHLATEAPILGGIAYDPRAGNGPLYLRNEPRGIRAESYRTLRTNLQFLEFEGPGRVIVVTSSKAAEGKSTSAANLAIALADTGVAVMLVDADLRAPRLDSYLGLESTVGLTDVLIGKVSVEDAAQDWGGLPLKVLPAGQIPPNPSELLGSKAMERLIGALRIEYSTVIVDAPPLLPVSDAAILARLTDGVILICAVGSTTRNQVRAAISSLAHVKGRLLGIMLTMVPTRGPDATAYGGYGYAYDVDGL